MRLSIGSMVKHISKCPFLPFLKRSEDLKRTWEDHINSRSNRLKTGVWIYYRAAAWLCVCSICCHQSKAAGVSLMFTVSRAVGQWTHTLKTSNIGVFLHLLALVSQGFIIIETNSFQVFFFVIWGSHEKCLGNFSPGVHRLFLLLSKCLTWDLDLYLKKMKIHYKNMN